jgi:hypothetical protein
MDCASARLLWTLKPTEAAARRDAAKKFDDGNFKGEPVQRKSADAVGTSEDRANRRHGDTCWTNCDLSPLRHSPPFPSR